MSAGGAVVTPFGRIKTEILSGLTVALALVPEAVAFAFVAGVHPLVGLYAAFIVGLVTAVAGGGRDDFRGDRCAGGGHGQLGGNPRRRIPVRGCRVDGRAADTRGRCRLGKFIRMVPYPVMLGFVNGLAIVIFLAQLEQFKITAPDGGQTWLSGQPLYLMLALVALTMALIFAASKLTRAIPAPLVAIGVVTALVIGLDLDTRQVGDLASIAGALPSFHIPMVPLTLETLWIILPYAVILAAIGLIESLLTLNLVNEILDTKGGASKECVGQGLANLVTGFFGGMGGCAMIGQSMINVTSGGRTRLSGISAALFLLAFILFASGIIEIIPLAALVGVMMMVVIGTFAWSSFRIINRIPRIDAFVLVLVSAITVASDLAIAVVAGVIVSALAFAWKAAKRIDIRASIDENGVKIYELGGPLFFGSTSNFQDMFDPKGDPDEVIVDFMNSRVWDHSGLQAIDTLAERYENAGKRLHLRHLSPDCRKLLQRAGKMVEVSVIEDPRYGVAVDYGDRFADSGGRP